MIEPAAAAPVAAFPWDAIIALCLGALQMSPAALWSATPREIAAILRSRQARAATVLSPPTRSEIEQLLALYPDQPSR